MTDSPAASPAAEPRLGSGRVVASAIEGAERVRKSGIKRVRWEATRRARPQSSDIVRMLVEQLISRAITCGGGLFSHPRCIKSTQKTSPTTPCHHLRRVLGLGEALLRRGGPRTSTECSTTHPPVIRAHGRPPALTQLSTMQLDAGAGA
jgi:hypothetical protein